MVRVKGVKGLGVLGFKVQGFRGQGSGVSGENDKRSGRGVPPSGRRKKKRSARLPMRHRVGRLAKADVSGLFHLGKVLTVSGVGPARFQS